MNVIAIDTETTGVDFYHGARPFLVTTFNGQENLDYVWDVDPKTRKVKVDILELLEVVSLIEKSDCLILQNSKFDFQALYLLCNDYGIDLNWPWDKTEDTLIAAHLLASAYPHDLTSLAIQYLGLNIRQYEDDMEKEVQSCRRKVRSKKSNTQDWMIAKKGLECMPSAKSSGKDEDKYWKYDTWLPQALAKHFNYPKNHKWYKVTKSYASTDSVITYGLWTVMKEEIENRGLWNIYKERMKVVEVAADIQLKGMSRSKKQSTILLNNYKEESEAASKVCLDIAKKYNYDLKLPNGSKNDSLMKFCFDVLKLPVVETTAKGNPSLNATAVDSYLTILPSESDSLDFVKNFYKRNKLSKSIQALEGYNRYGKVHSKYKTHDILHPSLNPTATVTLRWGGSNPNPQNISKGANAEWKSKIGMSIEDNDKLSLRHCFGPMPGREWWSLDYQNIELRIPAFEAGEQELIDIFLNPDKPPYYGSYHLVIFDVLHPQLFKEHGKQCKEQFKSTWYQWVKNGNFAIQYGAQQSKADATYRVEGAYNKIKNRFPKIAKLNEKMVNMANRLGYVTTIPDITVCSERGYPIMVSRTERGNVSPTTPLCYHVQSTAMWGTMKAMNRCYAQLKAWQNDGFDGFITMQVHDELVFDFPKRGDPTKEEGTELFRISNLWRIKKMKELMEQSGKDIGVPTPVGVDYHVDSWGKGIGVSV